MPKRITYLEKRDEMSREDFSEYWSTIHADIARDLPGVVAYRQNHVRPSSGAPSSSAPFAVDGIVELWFADESVVRAGFESDIAQRLAADETNFLSGLTGGAVAADEPCEVSPGKVWLLARWCREAAGDQETVRAWAEGVVDELPGALRASVNFLIPDAPVLTRPALRAEPRIPEVAIAFSFADETTAAQAASGLAVSGSRMQGVLSGVDVYLAEELAII